MLNNKHFLVKEISALKSVGLEDSIRWLYNTMRDSAKIFNKEKEKSKSLKSMSYVDLV